jgi:hypothetical protein
MAHRPFVGLWRARGVAQSSLGTFIFGFSSLIVTVMQQPSFVLLGLISLPTMAVAHRAILEPTRLGGRLMVFSALCLIAAQVSAVLLWFPYLGAFVYLAATMIGSLLAFRGITETV